MSTPLGDSAAAFVALRQLLEGARRTLGAEKVMPRILSWWLPASRQDTLSLSAIAGRLADALSQLLRSPRSTEEPVREARDESTSTLVLEGMTTFRLLYERAIAPRVDQLERACAEALSEFDLWTSKGYPKAAFDERLFQNIDEVDEENPSTPLVSASEAARFDAFCAGVQATLEAMVRRLEPLAGEQQDLYRIVEPLDREISLEPLLIQPGARTDLLQSALALESNIARVRTCTSSVEEYCKTWLARSATRLATGEGPPDAQ